MQTTLKKILSTLVVSASVFTVSHVIAAQSPSESSASATSVNGIDNVENQLSKALKSSSVALKEKVKSLSVVVSKETIAVALTNLGVSPDLALQSMVEAGTPVDAAVNALVAANSGNAVAIVKAAIKLNPGAKATIISAAISAGASPDDITEATAAGRDSDRGERYARRGGESRDHRGEHGSGGGGGVVTPPKPVSPN